MVPLKYYTRRRRIKHVPTEILTVIFAKVPMKYLLRLTSVCKSYTRLIRSPEFGKFHLEMITMKNAPDYLLVRNRNEGEERGFSIYSARTFAYDEGSGLPRSIDIPMRFLDLPLFFYGFTVHGSCNGLLCIFIASPLLEYPVYLYNPSLHKFKQLPQSEFRLPEGITITRGGRHVTLRFGFSSRKNDYQVVRFVHPPRGIFHAEVYSLKLNSWTTVVNIADPHDYNLATFGWFMDGCACLDGVIYWVLMSAGICIVSFDMGTAVLRRRRLRNRLDPVLRPNALQVLHPDCLRVLHEHCLPGLEQSLCLFQEIRRGDNRYCDIWVLKMDHEERICRIRLPPDASIAWPLGFSTNGNLVHMVINDVPDYPRLAQYVIMLDRLQNHVTQLSRHHWYVDAYRESLALLDEI